MTRLQGQKGIATPNDQRRYFDQDIVSEDYKILDNNTIEKIQEMNETSNTILDPKKLQRVQIDAAEVQLDKP